MNGGSAAGEPVGSLDVALAHAVRLLEQDPRLAAEQAGEILKAVPGHPNASLLLGMARRNGGDPAAALSVRSEEHTSELQSQSNLVCRLLLEKKNIAQTRLVA